MKKNKYFLSSDRYRFDTTLSPLAGWCQIDSYQDAWYFGQWCNPLTYQLVSYAEGDVCETDCDTEEEFWEEMEAIWKFDDTCRVDTMCQDHLTELFKVKGKQNFLHKSLRDEEKD